jgi:hypothetical protein
MKTYLLFVSTFLLTACSLPKHVCVNLPSSLDSFNDSLSVTENYFEPEREEKLKAFLIPETKIANNTNNKESSPKIITLINSRVITSTSNLGNVVYKIPSVMSFRNVSKVVVRVSKSTIHIYENLNGEIINAVIPVTETMEVRLVDPSSSDNKMFDIIAANSGEQIIENNESYTEWIWSVTPLTAGKGTLKIIVSIIQGSGKKEIVYEDEVVVQIDLLKQLKFFFNKYWQWLFGTIIIPFAIWLYNSRRLSKRRE